MSGTHFDLVILHHTSSEPVERLVRDLLELLNKQGDPYLEYKLSEALLFAESKTAVLENMSREDAEYYQKRFREFLVETELRPTLQLIAKEDPKNPDDPNAATHTCPACGHQQPKNKQGMNACQSCGVVGEKFERQNKREEVLEREKRKFEDSQSKLMKDALDRAKLEEDERLRREAREQLGLEKKRRPLDWLVGAVAVTMMGVSAVFIADTLRTPESEAAGVAGSKGSVATITDADAPKSKQADTNKPTESQAAAATVNAPVANAAVGAVNAAAANGKGLKISVNAPNGGIQVAGISDPMDRPTVEGTHLLPGENAPVAPAVGKGGQINKAGQVVAEGGAAAQGAAAAAAIAAGSSVDKQALAGFQPQPIVGMETQGAEAAMAQAGQELAKAAALTATELAELKTGLRPAENSSAQYFEKITPELFDKHQQKLDRLLNLGKPDLAVVFVEEVEDPYAASLLLLDVARSEAKKNSTAAKGDIIRSMKNLQGVASSVPQQTLVSSSLSQAHALLGDAEQAKAILDQAVIELRSTSPAQAEANTLVLTEGEKLDLILQMAKDHENFGNRAEAESLLQSAGAMVAILPADALGQSEALTGLASTSLVLGDTTQATAWLEKISDPVAKAQLLEHLATLKGTKPAP